MPQLVQLVWRDAWCDDRDDDPGSWPVECRVATVGWLVRDEPEVVSVAAERVELDSGVMWRAVTHVPRGAVIGLEALA